MAFREQDGSLHNSIATVRCGIQDILQSGNYYVTEEIAREMSVINHVLEHLSLDNTFLATSKEWQQNPGNYTPSQTYQHLSGALAAVNQVAATLDTMKQHFCNENIAGKQENQLREIHQWAISSLKNSQKTLEPYAYDSADRIKQFGDTLGVTDRYTSYRQNLTRGTRDPFRMQTSWMDKAGELGLMNKLTRSHATSGSPTLEKHFENRTVQFVGEPSTEFSEFGGVPPANIGVLKKQIRYGMTNPPMRVTRVDCAAEQSTHTCQQVVSSEQAESVPKLAEVIANEICLTFLLGFLSSRGLKTQRFHVNISRKYISPVTSVDCDLSP
ncbi:unnamed protein product [Candidula unifasciata]|uniref:Uncharacterized protein n=1 Tax=Candidula unifasciata TaxID=100452 RepID=A0A8S3ZW97_9EUPU|nr:unnamed protein product [Candidula unifasciata]